MAIVNAQKKAIDCKILYYGPGRCGKTANLDYISRSHKKQVIGEMVSISAGDDRALFLDCLPMGLGKIKGYDIKVQLYTVPGKAQYTSTRKLVLRGMDGIVFVADSLAVRREKNMLSLNDLQANLKAYNKSIFNIPLVLQYNKRDLAEEGIPLMPVEQMERDLNRQLNVPSCPASAVTGAGVGITLKTCLLETLKALQREFRWAE